ncbi:hypothetical protein BU16DRAFT_564930 [Lophium mytilinum]|uniref:Uncharacterized protein n=1 Tax=Lophium mytilinum TaxID=390894 RepID=A0A6A6QJ71_9PEZI|nr:hypothetical protein BU16DRAFT_564930 [Lophium mytilinum]
MSKAGQKPCYFLAPTRTCPPEGPIRLGSIISSPSLPDEPINTMPLPLEASAIHTHNQTNWTSCHAKTKSGRIGVWGSFLQFVVGAGGDVSVGWKNEDSQLLMAKNMCTRYFVPSQEYVRATVMEDSVREYIINNKFRERLFMITGVMIASGASGLNSYMRDNGIYAHVGVDATIPCGVPFAGGPKFEGHQTTKTDVAFEGADDFVFAFRLRHIKVKKTGEVSHKQYNKGALYDLDGYKAMYEKRAQEELELGFEVEGLAEDDATGGEFGLDGEELMDEGTGEECLCVVPED